MKPVITILLCILSVYATAQMRKRFQVQPASKCFIVGEVAISAVDNGIDSTTKVVLIRYADTNGRWFYELNKVMPNKAIDDIIVNPTNRTVINGWFNTYVDSLKVSKILQN